MRSREKGIPHRKLQRLHRREADKIHAGWVKLGWSASKLCVESKVERGRVALFCNHKVATVTVGFKLALTISSALAAEGKNG